MMDNGKFKNVESWQSALGLLGVPLRDEVHDSQRYVLLNGLSGNFCLDFNPSSDHLMCRSTAWSSDVGHYVAVCDETVTIHRWDRPTPPIKYTWRSVINNIHGFHRSLEEDEPDRAKSVVNHVLRVFRTLREALRERAAATNSLEGLMCLLACAASGLDRGEIDASQWGLSQKAVEIASGVPTATWDSLYCDLTGKGRYDVLNPDFELVLRHAAGTLFQEAHIEAIVSPNRWLAGLEGQSKLVRNARPETGVYFTPPAIARTLADEAIRALGATLPKTLVVFDPACGSGELLRECMRLLKLRGYEGSLEVVGYDSSPSSVAMARVVLEFEKRYWPPNNVKLTLLAIDSLTNPWPSGVNILIMNPPFQSWQQMDKDARDAIAPILGNHLRNKPNLAMVFASLAINSIGTDSVLAMVAPNSLLEAESGGYVREKLAARLKPLLIAKLGHQHAFAHAFVDAGMYVGTTRHSPQSDAAILWADPRPTSLSRALRGLRRWRGAEIEPLKDDGFAVYLRHDVATSGAPWIARSFDAWKSYERANQSKNTISAHEIFDIKQGVRLGSDVFIVPKDVVKTWPPSERAFFRPAVMNPSLVNGKLDDSYYVFYPYSDGLPPLVNEKDVAKHVSQYYATRLRHAKDKLAGRGTLNRERNLNWWDLLWRRPWQRGNVPKIVSKYFGGERSFAFDRGGEFIVVVGHAWLLQDVTADSRLTAEELNFATLAYLNSETTRDLLEYVSVQVSGGQVDLSNRYVKTLPIVNCAKCARPLVNLLADCGRRIANGSLTRWSDVDELVSYIISDGRR